MFLSAMHEVSNFSTFSPTFAIFPLHVETSFLILRKGIFSEYTFSCKVTEHSNWSCKKGIYWLGTSKGKQCSEFRGSRGALWTLSLSLPEAGSISQPGFSLMVTQGYLAPGFPQSISSTKNKASSTSLQFTSVPGFTLI